MNVNAHDIFSKLNTLVDSNLSEYDPDLTLKERNRGLKQALKLAESLSRDRPVDTTLKVLLPKMQEITDKNFELAQKSRNQASEALNQYKEDFPEKYQSEYEELYAAKPSYLDQLFNQVEQIFGIEVAVSHFVFCCLVIVILFISVVTPEDFSYLAAKAILEVKKVTKSKDSKRLSTK